MSGPSSHAWTNWAGHVDCNPEHLIEPESEAEVQRIVRACREREATLRVAGSGHSWTPLVASDGVLVSLGSMTGIVDTDRDAQQVTLLGGTTLEQAGIQLHERNLALPNLGDVSRQTVAGAFATGTHGTGLGFANLSTVLTGGRLVTGTGQIVSFDEQTDPEMLEAVRVSLGALGILTHMRLDVQTTFKVQRREYCARFEDFWPHLEELVHANRNFDFYWYPRSDEVKLRLLNPPGGGSDEQRLDYAEKVKDITGPWHTTIPEHNEIGRRFEEMEYAVPIDQGPACFLEVRERVRDRWRADVGWRLLCRTVAADEAMLSTEHGRDVMTISLIQNAQLAYWPYFQDVEPILRAHEGRPHWGKRHKLTGEQLAKLYPAWDRFQAIRRRLDPDGVLLTDYLAELLGEHAGGSS